MYLAIHAVSRLVNSCLRPSRPPINANATTRTESTPSSLKSPNPHRAGRGQCMHARHLRFRAITFASPDSGVSLCPLSDDRIALFFCLPTYNRCLSWDINSHFALRISLLEKQTQADRQHSNSLRLQSNNPHPPLPLDRQFKLQSLQHFLRLDHVFPGPRLPPAARIGIPIILCMYVFMYVGILPTWLPTLQAYVLYIHSCVLQLRC
ncbi:hypothetical protein BZA05DRAFT_55035 [Tricharina praecox]|uniref:uncharacterized protein n=1 Tax=Tricharina praecox TaxID=43433 RepID=UPI002221212B|nr:uncharacterized protein BZA05DRAFT_55035 [Tricharina praecox]KAI5850942.1 hypothetical protein BZA05DRAFT_55035 [Tricharina praecox]